MARESDLLTTLDPDDYPITQLNHISEIPRRSNDFYRRYSVPIDPTNIARCVDIIEGFEFDPQDHVEYLFLWMNASEYKFPVVDDVFRPPGFLFPRSAFVFVDARIRCDKPITNVRMICGMLDVNFEVHRYFGETREIRFRVRGQEYTIRTCEGTGWIEESSTKFCPRRK